MRLEEFLELPEEQRDISRLPDEQLKELTMSWVKDSAIEKQENQLVYYEPVSDKAKSIHTSMCPTIAAFGGKGSSKTDTMLAEMCICATGVIPDSLKDVFPRKKIKVGGNFRIIIESIKTTLYPIILPKLQYWHWDGVDEPGGPRGHWGWIPKSQLIQGDWKKSWKDKEGMLYLANGSTIQFMSYDQSAEDFASGAFDAILHDEPPPHAIWRESIGRVGRRDGRLYLSMTPPDEIGISVGWIFDEIYEQGTLDSPHKVEGKYCVTLFAFENKFVNVESVLSRAMELPFEQREVYLYGKFLHLSGLIHPSFTDANAMWCFPCRQKAFENEDHCCTRCGSSNIAEYGHVRNDITYDPSWPVMFILDPHPRKPHMMVWIAITPYDEFWQIAEAEVDGECWEVAAKVSEVEAQFSMNVQMRIIDPNMGRSASTSGMRHVSWQEDFQEVGINCILGDDNFEVGRSRINKKMAIDEATRRPNFSIDSRCKKSIYQFKRYVYDEHAKYTEKEPKQTARPKDDDYPTMWRYCLNQNMDFTSLRMSDVILRREVVGRSSTTGY